MSITFGERTTGLEVTNNWPASVRGRTFLITGVSPNGIGAATAKALASQQPDTLILTGRSESKTTEVIREIQKTTIPGKTRIVFVLLDLASNRSVREAANKILNDTSIVKIDVLINNAGVMDIPDKRLSEDGLEMHFASNHLGHFLFTGLLLPRLQQAAAVGSDVRVINLSSRGHSYSPVRFSDINMTKSLDELPESERGDIEQLVQWGHSIQGAYIPRFAYGQSKTANILHAVELTKRLSKHGIKSFALHPGGVSTELWRHEEDSLSRTKGLAESAGIHWKNPEQGSSTSLVAALDPNLSAADANGFGIYLEDCNVTPVKAAWATRSSDAKRLWELSEELVGQKFEP